MYKSNSLHHKPLGIPCRIHQLLCSWLLAAAIEFLLLPSEARNLAEPEGLAQMSIFRFGGMIVVFMAAQWISSRRFCSNSIGRWSLPAAFAVLAVPSLVISFSWPFLGACCLILAILVGYAIGGWNQRPEPAVHSFLSPKTFIGITAGIAVAFFLFISAWTVGRVYSFSTPTYDFGIFSQMFYSLKETGLPMTTLERDGMLSHFAVHVSPIYYLLLPLYFLCPAPATLQILQAAVMTSAVIPLWKIGKQHGLTGGERMLCCAMLLLYPAFSGGAGYDLHENCFLTPLILWLFYGIDRKNAVCVVLAALLTLSVKEDAAVYVAVIALWLILKTVLRGSRMDLWDLRGGIILFAGSLCWFFAVTGYLTKYGDGVMVSRYQNFLYGGKTSLAAVIKSVLFCPMKAVYECVDFEKLRFIALTLTPLLGLPLMTRRYERYILLIPYILVNLMPDYRYQHEIFFQYTFGSGSFLMYLTVVNLADVRKREIKTVALAVAAIVCGVCFCKIVIPKAAAYPVRAIQYWQSYQAIRDALDTVPDEASVAATTFYTTHLSQRETIYDIRYCSQEHLLETEYVVLSLTGSSDYTRYGPDGIGLENLVRLLAENGYKPSLILKDTLIVYHKEGLLQ